MSTYIFSLKAPVTSVKMRETPGHTEIVIFINHKCSGILTMSADEASQFLNILREKEACAVRRCVGEGKSEILWLASPLSRTLVSELGEVFDVEEVQK